MCRQTLTVFIFTLFTFLPGAHAEIYAGDEIYQDPVQAKENPGCADFYRVVRPLAPLINHVFVAMKYEENIYLYGASKGQVDLLFAQGESLVPETSEHTYLGSACDDSLKQATSAALLISLSWNKRVQSSLYFFPRMILTPAYGRICAVAAKNVIEEIRPLLSFRKHL